MDTCKKEETTNVCKRERMRVIYKSASNSTHTMNIRTCIIEPIGENYPNCFFNRKKQ